MGTTGPKLTDDYWDHYWEDSEVATVDEDWDDYEYYRDSVYDPDDYDYFDEEEDDEGVITDEY